MKISKLLRIAGLISFILVIANIISISQLQMSFNAERSAKERQLELDNLGDQLQAASDYLTDQVRNYAQNGNKAHSDAYWAEVNETKTREGVTGRLVELEVDQEYLNLLKQAEEESAELVLTEEIAMAEAGKGNLDQARILLYGDEYSKAKERISNLIVEFSDKVNNDAMIQAEKATNKSKLLFMVVYIWISLLILTIILTFLLLGKKIKSLQTITKRLDELASNDGDLTSRVNITSKDEIGEIAHSFNVFTEKIQNIVVDIARETKDVARATEVLTDICAQTSLASEEVARTIEDIALGAGDQARDTESGAMNINVLGDIIAKELLSIQELALATDTVESLIGDGFKILEELNDTTKESGHIAKEVYDIIMDTSKSAEKITIASEKIKSIAVQTNLLALNATIEAARAGESGRGFAVVADEIRKLAEDSSSFTNEIENVIQDLMVKTNQAVETTHQAEEITSNQSESVKSTSSKFNGISVSVDNMKKIARILDAQGRGMDRKKEEIIGTVENLSAIAQENAAGTQEASASVEEQAAAMEEIEEASERLFQQSAAILDIIGRFKY